MKWPWSKPADEPGRLITIPTEWCGCWLPPDGAHPISWDVHNARHPSRTFDEAGQVLEPFRRQYCLQTNQCRDITFRFVEAPRAGVPPLDAQRFVEAQALLMLAYDLIHDETKPRPALLDSIAEFVAPAGKITPKDLEWAAGEIRRLEVERDKADAAAEVAQP